MRDKLPEWKIKRIIKIREETDLPVTEIANEMNVHYDTVNEILRENRKNNGQ